MNKDYRKVTLYTIHCPQCKVLEKKLQIANITYAVVDDISEFEKKGFKSAPVLVVDDEALKFSDAVNWIKEQA